MKIETVKIPQNGIYVIAGAVKYHLQIYNGEVLSVRCVSNDNGGGERIMSTMPAGNQIDLMVV